MLWISKLFIEALEGNPMQEKIPSLIAVRLQDGLHGLYTDGNGVVHLPFKRDDKDRNTLHFSLNCVVGNHVYGTFTEENPDGSLSLGNKGSVVILSPLNEMPVPAGFNQVDTWFRLSAEKNADGTLVRSLPVGRATVVAPQGTQIPGGVNALFYDPAGGVAARDAVVSDYFAQAGVPQYETSLRSWNCDSEGEARIWAKNTAKVLYPDHAINIHCDMHDSSIDNVIESFGAGGLLPNFRGGNRLYETSTGVDASRLEVISARATKKIAQITEFLKTAPDIDRSLPFYEHLIAKENAYLAEARILDAKLEAEQKPSIIQSALSEVRGQGAFFLQSSPNSTEHIQMTANELAGSLVRGEIESSRKIWRSGMSDQWETVKKSDVGRALGYDFEYKKNPVPPPPPPGASYQDAPQPVAAATISNPSAQASKPPVSASHWMPSPSLGSFFGAKPFAATEGPNLAASTNNTTSEMKRRTPKPS